MFVDVFGDAKDLIKLQSTCIDNVVFSLHYRTTVIMLIAFSLIITTKQYMGDPIDCIVDNHETKDEKGEDGISLNAMDAYCWIYSTFTVPNRLAGRIGKDIVQPGVGSYVDKKEDVMYHKYYQWMSFVLVFQAMFFYLPRYLWRTWEAGRLKMLSNFNWTENNKDGKGDDEKNDQKNEKNEADNGNKIQLVVEYFQQNLRYHNFYVIRFILCELLNFVNVISQIYFVDYFLEGEFWTYGWDVMKFSEKSREPRVDPMVRIFPKLTKCTFRRYGPSGSLEILDALCVLPLNMFNEKIYLFLWFWFILLTVLTGLCIIYRITIVMCPMLRLHLLRYRFRLASRKDVQIIADKFLLGDWFILYQLGKNMDPLTFEELISSLACNFSDERKVTFAL